MRLGNLRFVYVRETVRVNSSNGPSGHVLDLHHKVLSHIPHEETLPSCCKQTCYVMVCSLKLNNIGNV